MPNSVELAHTVAYRRHALRVVLLCLIVALGACAGGGGDGGGGSGPKDCVCDPPGCPILSFSQNIQPIFNQSCAQSAACHTGGTPPQDLSLSVGQAYSQTVGVPSTERRNELRVKPGKPDDSFLITKIEFPPGTPGLPMPTGCPGSPLQGAVCPSSDDIAALRQWITECAPNN